MRIGFDGKDAVTKNSTHGNYSRLAVEELSKAFPTDHFVVFTPKVADSRDVAPLMLRTNIRLRQPRTAIFKSWWRTHHGIIKDARHYCVHLFHGLSGELPAAKTHMPMVVTIHDMAFKLFPHYFSSSERRRLNKMTHKACERATHIIAVSENVKRALVDSYGIAAERISVVYQGCEKCYFEPAHEEKVKQVAVRYKLPERYLFIAGDFNEGNNQLLAVEALAKTNDKDLCLVIAGHRTRYFNTVMHRAQELGLSHRVIALANIKDTDLPTLYHEALALVHPMKYDGRPMPVIKALASGVPVITSDFDGLRETGGDGSIYISPTSEEQLAEAFNKVAGSSDICRKMAERGREHAKRFEPQTLAQGLHEVYRKILHKEL